MQELDEEFTGVLRTTIGYFATAFSNAKPNVVPVGLLEPIGDDEVLVIDILFKKTMGNLEENP